MADLATKLAQVASVKRSYSLAKEVMELWSARTELY